jgi:hypothetical protein
VVGMGAARARRHPAPAPARPCCGCRASGTR